MPGACAVVHNASGVSASCLYAFFVNAAEAAVVCVAEVVSDVDAASTVVSSDNATAIVQSVLHPYFGLGDAAAKSGDALMSLAVSSATGVAGNSLQWMSAYVTARQCTYKPLRVGQVEDNWQSDGV